MAAFEAFFRDLDDIGVHEGLATGDTDLGGGEVVASDFV